MTASTRDTLKRWAAIIGALVGLVTLATAAAAFADARYVTRAEYQLNEQAANDKLQRLLDVACDGRKQAVRACQ